MHMIVVLLCFECLEWNDLEWRAFIFLQAFFMFILENSILATP